MPSTKPPPRKPAKPESNGRNENTDPGGPSAEILAEARLATVDSPPEAAGPGDATLVYDRNKGRAKGQGNTLLVAVAGPRTGSEFPLSEARTTIGRGSENTIVIPDISVSRQHVVLELEGERWTLLDQGSGNGTKVNGRQVDRHPLVSGDEIAMGDTVVQFVEPGGVAVRGGKRTPMPSPALKPAAPQPPRAGQGLGDDRPEVTSNKAAPLKTRAPIYLAVLGVLMLFIGAGLYRRAQRARADAEAAHQGDESRALAGQRFQEGVALLKQSRWMEARDKLHVASELSPGDPEIGRYLERAEAEAPRAQALLQAKAALQRKDYAAARTAIEGVPDDSALVETAHDLAQQIKGALDQAVREARLRVEAGDASAASELIEPVLAAEPARADALAVKDAVAGQKRSAGSSTPRRERSAAAAQPKAESQGASSGPILDAYLSGDIGAAIERAEAGQGDPVAARMLGQLRQVDNTYKDGLAKIAAKKPTEAIKALEQAERADHSLAQSKDSRLGHEVRKALGNLHYQLGIASVQTDEGLPQAAIHLRAAVAADPANDLAQQQLAQVIGRAKELYLRGYVAKDNDSETARHAFKLVTETLPATDETAQKAKRWLDKIDGKGPKEDG